MYPRSRDRGTERRCLWQPSRLIWYKGEGARLEGRECNCGADARAGTRRRTRGTARRFPFPPCPPPPSPPAAPHWRSRSSSRCLRMPRASPAMWWTRSAARCSPPWSRRSRATGSRARTRMVGLCCPPLDPARISCGSGALGIGSGSKRRRYARDSARDSPLRCTRPRRRSIRCARVSQNACDNRTLLGFECRRQSGIGHFRDANELAALDAEQLIDLARDLPGIRPGNGLGPNGLTELVPWPRPSRCLRSRTT